MEVAREMWRLASMPPAPLMAGAMVAVLAWSLIFRRQDKAAPIMAATIITAWVVELFLKAVIDANAFRGFIAISDTVCALICLRLGERTHKEWLLVTYTSLVYAILAHVLWLFGAFQVFLTKNDYIALLNILLALRLVCIAFPGVAYVGKSLGDLLPRSSSDLAPQKAPY